MRWCAPLFLCECSVEAARSADPGLAPRALLRLDGPSPRQARVSGLGSRRGKPTRPLTSGLQSLLGALLPQGVADDVNEHLPCGRRSAKPLGVATPPQSLPPGCGPHLTQPSHVRRSHPGSQTTAKFYGREFGPSRCTDVVSPLRASRLGGCLAAVMQVPWEGLALGGEL